MKPFQKILVACDLSKFTNQVLDYAVALALSTGARLILGNVINQRDVDAIESAIHKTYLVEKEASPEAYIRQHKLERERESESADRGERPPRPVFKDRDPNRGAVSGVNPDG